MPPAMQGTGGDQRDSGTGILWIMFGAIIAIVIIWVSAHVYLVTAYFKIKLFELAMIGFFTHSADHIRTIIQHANPALVTYNQVFDVADAVGHYLKIPVAVILVLFAVLLYFKSAVSRFCHIYTMKTLLMSGVKLWPQSKPAETNDFIAQDIEEGPWSLGMTPMQFAKRYHLLKEKKAEIAETQLRKEAKITVSLIQSRANHLFTLQLGREWHGVDRLPPHAKALYAAFAAKAARDSKGSKAFLDKIASSWEAGKVNFDGTYALLQKYKNDPSVVEITSRHAYELTVLASLLQLARSDGVLATAEFLWLKPIDRRLWFMLNSVGRQTVIVEAGGAIAHWLAEKELGRKIRTPMVEQATLALAIAIQEIKYIPEPKKQEIR